MRHSLLGGLVVASLHAVAVHAEPGAARGRVGYGLVADDRRERGSARARGDLRARARPRPLRLVPGATLSGPDLREVPGTFGDPLRAVTVQPGVGQVISGTGHAVVRGLAPSATRYTLDGVELPSLFHLLAGPGVLNPALVDAIEIERGPTAAHEGRALGGTVEARLLPRSERLHFEGQVDLLNAALLAQVPVTPDLEVIASGRFAYSPYLGTSVLNALSKPAAGKPSSALKAEVYDYQAVVRQRLGSSGGELRLLAFGSSDRGGIASEAESILLGARFHRADLALALPVSEGTLHAGVTLGYDGLALDDAGGPSAKFSTHLVERSVKARASYELPLGSTLRLRAGADFDRRLAYARPDEPDPPRRRRRSDPSRDRLERAADARPGHLRRRLSRGRGRRGRAPAAPGGSPRRLSPGRRVRRRGARAAAARRVPGERAAHRPRPGRLLPPAARVPDSRSRPWPRARSAPGCSARSRSARARTSRSARAALSLDAFARPYEELLTLSLGDLDFFAPDFATRAEARRELGSSFGFELGGKWPVGERLSLQGSYAFVAARRTGQVDRHDDTGAVTSSVEASYAASLAQAHLVNATARYELGGGFIAGATLHFNTGAPEAGDVFSFTQRAGIDPDTGKARWIPEDRDRVANLPAFVRLDARIAKQWRGGGLDWEAFLEVMNLSLQKETFRFGYGAKAGALERTTSLAPLPVVLPFLGIKASG